LVHFVERKTKYSSLKQCRCVEDQCDVIRKSAVISTLPLHDSQGKTSGKTPNNEHDLKVEHTSLLIPQVGVVLLGDDLLNFERQAPVLHSKDRMRDYIQLDG
jgi:hypothetical protein